MARQPSSAASAYVFPLIGKFHYTRTDMGVDYAPSGKTVIRAMGRAKILATKPPPNWPEGGGILYQLLDGPYKGRIVYTYEGVDAASYLKPGMTVGRGQAIGTLREGGSIEMGWADARGETLAHDRGEHAAGNSNLRAGKEFLQFLGHVQRNEPPQSAYEAPSLAGQLGQQFSHPGQSIQETAGIAGKAAGGLAGEIVSGILGDIHAESFMLTAGLLIGGAFLVYYGAALMAGVKRPVAAPVMLAATKGAVK